MKLKASKYLAAGTEPIATRTREMEVMMKFIIYGIFLYILAFIIDYKIIKQFSLNEYEYMAVKFNLKKKKKIPPKIKVISSFINAFIITLVWIFNFLFNFPLFIKLVLSFVLLIILIYTSYQIYGMVLRSRGYGKEKK